MERHAILTQCGEESTPPPRLWDTRDLKGTQRCAKLNQKHNFFLVKA